MSSDCSSSSLEDLPIRSDRSGNSKEAAGVDCDLSGLCLESPDSKNVVKASELFDEAEDVAGGNIYSFKTPKKRNAMSLMAASATTPKSSSSQMPTTPGTGRKSTSARETQLGKTPQHIRAKIKKRLTKIVESSSDSFSLTEDSSTDSEGESTSTDSEEDEPKTPRKRIVRKVAPSLIAPMTPVATRKRNLRTKTESQFCLKSDNYFSSQTTKGKSLTSDHTLDHLKTPRLPHSEMMKLLDAVEFPEEHETAIKELQGEYKSFFWKWLCILNEGFNLLLYGLGSKRNLMNEFHREMLSDQHVLVVNGFFPSLTIKDILSSVICDILELESVPTCPYEAVQLIENEMQEREGSHLFLIVHNLEGAMLRNGKAQTVLSQIAKIPSIHLIASIDHINTALLWDHSKLSNYNFTWWDVTSMLPYTEETAFENSLMIQNSGALALSSLKSVFQSLTTNAKGVFMLIVRKQLENRSNSNYPGMLFRELYSKSREAFLVSSDLALRAQLTELLDHKAVKMRQGIDGGEYLSIPIDGNLLQQFQQENQI
ncbi:origin recognition complex subunit 2 isoform X2 [Lutzomyia longipalpis]|uniref:origin recognition complex subunit 2 isoform X2 n=1 Tax=Lutzomyia longipalpis TaxID=7200 RepID=UPI002483871B|nr:origin recognition complex subunit 2 isoform X2 [Lutzomyia longipalpis]